MRYGCVLSAVLVLLAAGAVGCQTPRTTFRADGETSVPTVAAARESDQPAAGGVTPRSREDLLRNARLTDLEPPAEEPGEGAWSKLLGRFRKPKPQPVSLPRTDLPTENVFEDPKPIHLMTDGF